MSKSVIPEDLKCVIFDMDGVLYDSMKNHEITWTKCFKKEGIDIDPSEAYLNEGRPGVDTVGVVFQKYLNREATKEDKERVYAEKVKHMSNTQAAEKLPKMEELIIELKKHAYDVWVVTGSKQPTLLNRLKNDFEIDHNHVISAKDVKKGKPHPEPYLKAVERSGFEAEQCMVVENAPLGVRAAKAAGITTIAVNTGVLKDADLSNEGADIVLPDTVTLFEYIKDGLMW